MFKKLLSMLENKDKETENEPLSDIKITAIYPEPRKLTNEEQTLADLQARAAESTRDKDFQAAAELQRKYIEFAKQNGLMVRAAHYIRLARHLQASGKNDEGWKVFNKSLLLDYTKLDDKIEIYNAMRIFLQREGRHKLAVQYGIASYLFGVEKEREWTEDKSKEIRDLMSEYKNSGESEKWLEEIIESELEFLEDHEKRLLEQIDKEVIRSIIENLLKKTKLQEAELELVNAVEKQIALNTRVNIGNLLREIGVVTNKYDS